MRTFASDTYAAVMSEKKLRMVKVVLHWVWNPIGVRGVEEAVDTFLPLAAFVTFT